MALKPLRKWTNRLAWAVWSIRNKNKERSNGGAIPPPAGNNVVFMTDNLVFSGDDVVYT